MIFIYEFNDAIPVLEMSISEAGLPVSYNILWVPILFNSLLRM